MSTAAVPTIANEPKMHRVRACGALVPAMKCPAPKLRLAAPSGLCRCAPAMLPGGSRSSFVFQSWIQRGEEGQQSSRLRDMLRGHAALTCFFKPRNTRFEDRSMPPHSGGNIDIIEIRQQSRIY